MITSRELAEQLLTALSHSGVAWCFLHGEARWASGDLSSDLDLAVGGDPLETVRRIAEEVPNDVSLVMLWPYDPWSLTTFWMNASGHLSQLDLTHDRWGRNKYGVRTTTVLDSTQRGVRWPSATAVDESIYLIAKKLHKGQFGSAMELRAAVTPATAARASSVLNRAWAKHIAAFLKGTASGRGPRPARIANWLRLATRLSKPVGVWISVPDIRTVDMPGAAACGQRWKSLLPNVVWNPTVRWARLRAWMYHMKPALIVTLDQRPEGLADETLPLDFADPDSAFAEIREAMSRVAQRRLEGLCG
jgi:hypothetical protein